jgi:hypothetical protein
MGVGKKEKREGKKRTWESKEIKKCNTINII